MELSDRDRMLLVFANLASHGIAARPAMASDAAGLAAGLGARHPGGLGSYVVSHRDDDASFDPTGTLGGLALAAGGFGLGMTFSSLFALRAFVHLAPRMTGRPSAVAQPA